MTYKIASEFPNIDLLLTSNYGKYLCEIDRDFITDKFNLTGIPQEFAYFDKLYKILLSDKPIPQTSQTDEYNFYDLLTLYGLIHARYIISPNGLHRMRKKFINGDFGTCPRYYCRRQHLLPVGLCAAFNINFPRSYCPNCQDVYDCEDKYFNRMDGSFFGPTFPMFFLMTYPELQASNTMTTAAGATGTITVAAPTANQRPITAQSKDDRYCPKIFGFKIVNRIKQQSLLTELAD